MNKEKKQLVHLSDRGKKLWHLVHNPLDPHNFLNVTTEDMKNFKYRLVICDDINDPSRVSRMQDWGYETFSPQEIPGDKVTGKPSRMGKSTATLPTKDGRTYILMRIPKDLFKENQQIKDLKQRHALQEISLTEVCDTEDKDDPTKKTKGAIEKVTQEGKTIIK